jgi:ATP-binding cassette subfamily B protein
MASVDKLDSLLSQESERSGGEVPESRPTGSTVVLRSVAFRHDADRAVFSDFHATIEPGNDLAILGGEGIGKTAWCEILIGRRSPSSGLIEIDGIDLRRWSLPMLRERVAYVGEEPCIIEATLLENVRRGRESIDMDAVRSVLSIVELLDEVLLLPDGIDTRIEAVGSPLSCGQARRLALAAALAGRPSLLIIDCLFDSVEPERRRRIWQAMRRNLPSTTILTTRNSEIARLCRATATLTASTDRERSDATSSEAEDS